MSRELDERELSNLLDMVCRDEIDDKSWERLEQILLADPTARALYRRYINSHIGLKQYLTPWEDAHPVKSVKSPVLGLLGSGVKQVANFCWKTTPFSILVAIGLPLICVLLLTIQFGRPEALRVNTTADLPAQVARLERVCDCEWAKNIPTPAVGKSFLVGQQVELVRGLAEMTTMRGASIIIEGPAIFQFESCQQVDLKSGKLTARISKRAKGFRVDTPYLSIVDLGTEFGVSTEGAIGRTNVEVFQGEVDLRAGKKNSDNVPIRQRLVAGRAVCVERMDGTGKTTIHSIKPSAIRFVRQLPNSPKDIEPSTAKKVVIANFSGGNGNTEVDQFPGISGEGWTTKWILRNAEGIESIASVESANPILGGGNYLNILAIRQSGINHVRRSIYRRLDLDGQVDLKRRHVISFDIRIEAMGLFDSIYDMITICSNSERDADLDCIPSAGWHLRVRGGRDSDNWKFGAVMDTGAIRQIDSGIAAREGNTYSFRILVDPKARLWTPSIAVNGGQFQQFKAMKMRSSGNAQQHEYWPFLHFRWEMRGGNKGDKHEKVGFSADSIRIIPVDDEKTP